MTDGHSGLDRRQTPRATQTRNVQITSGTNEDTLQNIQQSCHQDNRPCHPIKRLYDTRK